MPPVQPKPAASPTSEPWTPAQTAQVLKAALYIIVGLAAWFFYRHSGSGSQEGHTLESEAGEPDAGDYSSWEPES